MWQRIKDWWKGIKAPIKKGIFAGLLIVVVAVICFACSSLDGVDTIQYGIYNTSSKEVT